MFHCIIFKDKCFYGVLNCLCNFLIQCSNTASICLSAYGLSTSEYHLHSLLVIISIFISTVCMSLKQSLNLEIKQKQFLNTIEI